MTLIATIREYFFLNEARATANVVPEDARAAISRQLAIGRQRSDAADALWSNGHVAEGLRLAAEAFEATIEAIAPFERAVAPGSAPTLGTEPLGERRSDGEGDSAAAGGAQSGDSADDGDDETASPASAADSAEATAGTAEEGADAAADDGVARDVSAAPTNATALDEPTWLAPLRRRGLSESKARIVLEASRALRGKVLPTLDDEVSAQEGDLFQQLVTARRHIESVLAPASMTQRQLAWTRASRMSFAALIACALVVGLYFLLRPETGVVATASSQFSNEFRAQNVIDGDEASEWLLPDRRDGWIELRIMPPEDIGTLRIKNSHNRHHNDRATHEYTIEVFANGRVAKTIDGVWPQLTPTPEWTEHAVDVEKVERIRVHVKTWHRLGGGLAEIEWD